jgi:hypothetical protein
MLFCVRWKCTVLRVLQYVSHTDGELSKDDVAACGRRSQSGQSQNAVCGRLEGDSITFEVKRQKPERRRARTKDYHGVVVDDRPQIHLPHTGVHHGEHYVCWYVRYISSSCCVGTLVVIVSPSASTSGFPNPQMTSRAIALGPLSPLISLIY